MNVRRLGCWFIVIATISNIWLAGIGCQFRGTQAVRRPVRHSIRSEQLLVLSDIQLDKEHPLIQDLIRLRQQVSKILQLPLQSRPVVVYLFSDESKYRRYLEAAYPSLPPRRAYFVGTPQELAVYTFWGENIREDLRHEFTHGLLHSCLKYVPLWLDEGLAEYFEVAGPTPGSINMEYADRLSMEVVNGWRPDIKRLEQLQNVSSMHRIDYRESWAWMHFLIHGSPETRQLLLAYLQDLKTAPHPGPLSNRLAREFTDLEARFLSYLTSINTFQAL